MHEVTRASLCEWLARPEWQRLTELLKGLEDDALQSLMATDPRDTAAVARAQAEVRVLRFFTSGEAADALINETKP
ncbi:MAG: hypothetical protein WD716_13315 [Fimbriimonadaceae bacterium]